MKKYDVNKDGRINEKDVKIINDYISMLSKLNIYDVNDDGKINLSDYYEWRRQFNLNENDDNGLIQKIDATLIGNAIGHGTTTREMDINKDGVVSMSDVTDLDCFASKVTEISKKMDVDRNGVISEIDGILLRKIVSVCRELHNQMDVNKDGKVNMGDVVAIQQNFD